MDGVGELRRVQRFGTDAIGNEINEEEKNYSLKGLAVMCYYEFIIQFIIKQMTFCFSNLYQPNSRSKGNGQVDRFRAGDWQEACSEK